MRETQTIPVEVRPADPLPVFAKKWFCCPVKKPSRSVVSCSTLPMALTLLVLCALNRPGIAAASPDTDSVLAEVRHRIETLDYRASGELTRMDGQGHRTRSKFNVKGHWFPDGLRLLVETAGVPVAPSQALLHMSVSGQMTIEVLTPGNKVATLLPYTRWNEGILGTDLSYEDLVKNEFFWRIQESLAPEKYSSHSCFVVRSTADGRDRSHYTSVTSWIDRDMSYPVHVLKALRGTGQTKEFNYFGFRRSGAAWSATHLEVKMQGGEGSSLFVIQRGSDKARLTMTDFVLGRSAK
jgi:hypothetical protein